MLMRQDVLEITGIKASAYDALSNRGLLPFKRPKSATRGYGEAELIKLGLFKALAAAGAVQAVASQAVRTGFNDFDSFAAHAGASSGSAFQFGVASWKGGELEAEWTPIFGLWRPRKALKLEIMGGEAAPDEIPAMMLMIDATAVVGEILAAAKRAGRSGQELEAWAVHFRAKVK